MNKILEGYMTAPTWLRRGMSSFQRKIIPKYKFVRCHIFLLVWATKFIMWLLVVLMSTTKQESFSKTAHLYIFHFFPQVWNFSEIMLFCNMYFLRPLITSCSVKLLLVNKLLFQCLVVLISTTKLQSFSIVAHLYFFHFFPEVANFSKKCAFVR